MKLSLGENIKRKRIERKLTQEEVATHLGVSFQSVSKWERGEGYPDIELLPALAAVLGVSVQELLEGKRLAAVEESCSGSALSAVCSYGADRRKAQTKRFLAAGVIWFVTALLIFALLSVPCLIGFYRMVMGSENCVIASDYSSLSYFGQKYIPLPLSAGMSRSSTLQTAR